MTFARRFALALAALLAATAPARAAPERIEPGVAYYSDESVLRGDVHDLGPEKNLEEVYQFYTYYEAVYDAERRVVRFREYERGEPAWTETYAYGASGELVEKTRTPAGGATEVIRFAAPGPELTAFVDSVLDAYGGPDAIARLEALRVAGRIEAHMRGATGHVRRDFEAPDRLRVAIEYPGTSEVRILNGERAWRGDAARQIAVDGLPRLAMVYQLVRSTLPWSLIRYRSLLTDAGSRTEEGRSHRILGLAPEEGLELELWVDAGNRRITRVDGRLASGGAQMSFRTRYADFRDLEGLWLPHAEETFAGGRHTASIRILSVEVGAEQLGPFAPDAAPQSP